MATQSNIVAAGQVLQDVVRTLKLVKTSGEAVEWSDRVDRDLAAAEYLLAPMSGGWWFASAGPYTAESYRAELASARRAIVLRSAPFRSSLPSSSVGATWPDLQSALVAAYRTITVAEVEYSERVPSPLQVGLGVQAWAIRRWGASSGDWLGGAFGEATGAAADAVGAVAGGVSKIVTSAAAGLAPALVVVGVLAVGVIILLQKARTA